MSVQYLETPLDSTLHIATKPYLIKLYYHLRLTNQTQPRDNYIKDVHFIIQSGLLSIMIRVNLME